MEQTTNRRAEIEREIEFVKQYKCSFEPLLGKAKKLGVCTYHIHQTISACDVRLYALESELAALDAPVADAPWEPKVGDEVLVKGKVVRVDGGSLPYGVEFACNAKGTPNYWFSKSEATAALRPAVASAPDIIDQLDAIAKSIDLTDQPYCTTAGGGEDKRNWQFQVWRDDQKPWCPTSAPEELPEWMGEEWWKKFTDLLNDQKDASHECGAHNIHSDPEGYDEKLAASRKATIAIEDFLMQSAPKVPQPEFDFVDALEYLYDEGAKAGDCRFTDYRDGVPITVSVTVGKTATELSQESQQPDAEPDLVAVAEHERGLEIKDYRSKSIKDATLEEAIERVRNAGYDHIADRLKELTQPGKPKVSVAVTAQGFINTGAIEYYVEQIRGLVPAEKRTAADSLWQAFYTALKGHSTDAEPVGYGVEYPSGMHSFFFEEYKAKAEAESVGGKVVPLYRHPAPTPKVETGAWGKRVKLKREPLKDEDRICIDFADGELAKTFHPDTARRLANAIYAALGESATVPPSDSEREGNDG